MKNAFSPTTHLAAALLGGAVATTLLTNEPLGLSLTPRMETNLQVQSTVTSQPTTCHIWKRRKNV